MFKKEKKKQVAFYQVSLKRHESLIFKPIPLLQALRGKMKIFGKENWTNKVMCRYSFTRISDGC